MKWCRFTNEGETSFGLIEGDSVRRADGAPVGAAYGRVSDGSR